MKARFSIPVLLLLLTNSALFSQSLMLNWVGGTNGSTNCISQAMDLAPDSSMVVVGSYSGSVDLDPGPGTFILNVWNGNNNAFIVKLDQAGNFVWAKSIEGTLPVEAHAIDHDAMGNMLIAGSWGGMVDFDPGAGQDLRTGSGNDMFVLKLDASGNYLWAKTFGGEFYDKASGLAVGATGQSLITGNFRGTVDFDPGVGVANLSSGMIGSTFSSDMFVLELTSNGDYSWAKQCGSADFESGQEIEMGANGEIYVAGEFWSTADFDPGPGTTNLTANGFSGLFIVKLSSTGDLTWAKGIDSPEYDLANALALDGNGNVHLTGIFGGNADFDPSTSGTANLSSQNTSAAYLLKLDANGNYQWAHAIGTETAGAGSGYALATDATGNAYFGGLFQGNADFDPGPGTVTLSALNTSNAFLAKYSPQGALVFADQLVHVGPFSFTEIEVDGNGSLFATGYFGDTADFDLGAGISNLYSTPFAQNMFAAKYNQVAVAVDAPASALAATTYPNPAHDMLRIRTTQPLLDVAILNTQGQLLRIEKQAEFSVANLPGGLYFLRVRTEAGETALRFVKAD